MPGHGKRHRLPGVFFALASVLFFVAMNVQARYLSAVPAAEKVMFRMLVGSLAVMFMVRLGLVEMRFGNIPLLALRGALGATAVLFYFYSIDHTALARAAFFLFTSPAWGALCSVIFLKEPLGWLRVPGVAAIYVGAYLILTGRSGADAAEVTLAGDLAGLSSGLFAGAAITTVRALHRYDTTWMIFLFFCFFGAASGALVTASTGSYVSPSWTGWAVLVGIGLAAMGAHLLYTMAFKYLDVTTAGGLQMLQAPLSGVAAWLLLDEALAALTLIGGGLVLAGGIYMAFTTRARKMEMEEVVAEP